MMGRCGRFCGPSETILGASHGEFTFMHDYAEGHRVTFVTSDFDCVLN